MLYEKDPEYLETINYFMYKGSGIYDYSTKKLSELNIKDNFVLILNQSDQRRKDERKELIKKRMFERQKKLRKQKELDNDSSLTEEQKINVKINNDLENMYIWKYNKRKNYF